MIAGMDPATGGEDIHLHLHLYRIMVPSNLEIANIINVALLEPMHDYSPLACFPPVFMNLGT